MSPIERPIPPIPADPEEDTIHLVDAWNIVRRRLWIVIVVLVSTLGAVLWATSQRPDVYQSYLALQVNDPSARGRNLNVVRNVSLNELHVDPVQSELEVLRSRPIADTVIQALGMRLVAADPGLVRSDLFTDAHVAPGFPSGGYELEYDDRGRTVRLLGEEGNVLAEGPVRRPLQYAGLRLTPARPPGEARAYALQVVDPAYVAPEVLAGLQATPREATNVIDVSYTGRDPELTPRILQEAARALALHGVIKNRTVASQTVDFLEEQLQQSYGQLRESLDRVKAFKSSRSLTDLTSEEQTVFKQIQEYQASAERLSLETSAYAGLIGQLQSGGVDPAELERLSALPSLADNPSIQYNLRQLLDLRGLRQQKTTGGLAMDGSHPEIQGLDARIRQTEENLLNGLKSQLNAVRERQVQLDRAVEEGRSQLARFPELQTELGNLELQKDIYMQNHQYLLAELQRAQLAEAVVAPYVDVIDPATTAVKINRGRFINVGVGVVLGLFLGVLFAVFLNYLDRTIRTSADVERLLALPTLGLIPRLPRQRRSAGSADAAAAKNGRAPHELPSFAADPLSPAAEAYRSLQVNLLFSRSADHPLRTVTITSATPAEGKSTTALNLAAVLSQQGKRTLLVDADLRNPRLHKALGLLRNPGLSNVLVGDCTASEAIRREVLPMLDVLPAGPFPPNPAELLSSTRLRTLLEELREEYDWVLLDAPPTLAVTDAALLGRQTDGLVFVVRAGDTEQSAAVHAVERLRRVGVNLVGVVLNEVHRSSSPDAEYTEYYYRYAPESRGKTVRDRSRELIGNFRGR